MTGTRITVNGVGMEARASHVAVGVLVLLLICSALGY